jgi:NAD(P)-dependent dehydrogenase (short-subunit alcohol dehydrogenase family)
MQDFSGKVAVITGAASGIGLGCARTFARAGMKVALCDLRADALEHAVTNIRALGGEAIGIPTDVSRHESVEQAASEVVKAFGKIHLAMNNAGVVLRGLPMTDVSDNAWNWVLGVNLYGVIHGIQSFVPRIRAHGEGGHVINTASMAGLHVGNRQTGAYSASKFAVVALTEALEKDLAGTNIGVSVLTPAAVATNIYSNSAGLRTGLSEPNPFAQTPADIAAGLTPDEVGARVLAGIRAGQFYLITHPDTRSWVMQRHTRLMAAYDFADASEAKQKAQDSVVGQAPS